MNCTLDRPCACDGVGAGAVIFRHTCRCGISRPFALLALQDNTITR